jgi:predicted GIY-YIG superfamily endonuclease
MSGGYIYILGLHSGTLYIGVTSNLYVGVMRHKEDDVFVGFLKKNIPTSYRSWGAAPGDLLSLSSPTQPEDPA